VKLASAILRDKATGSMEEDATKRLLSTAQGKLRARERWQQDEEAADLTSRGAGKLRKSEKGHNNPKKKGGKKKGVGWGGGG
jgi:hypothetical protein